jgi:hypothetical protein
MFNFAPHKEKFFDLFKEAAQNALAGVKMLKEMLDRYDHRRRCDAQIFRGPLGRDY